MNDWLFTERKRNANKFAIEKIKWNVLFHYLSLFIVIVAVAAVWGAIVCIGMSYYCICHWIQFELETIVAAAWLYDQFSSPPLLTDKSNKKPKKVTRTCTVAMMMMMVLMISSAIMWMLHILSLSSHQRQTKWNKTKTGTKEHDVSRSVHKSNKNDQFNGRLINNRHFTFTFTFWTVNWQHRQSNNANPSTQWMTISFLVILTTLRLIFVQIHKTKRHEQWCVLYVACSAVLCSAIQKWKKLNVYSSFYPIMTKAVNGRWRANGCVLV